MVLVAALLALAAPGAAHAQSTLAAACADPSLPSEARPTCFAVAQTAESLQPQLGVLIAGGNPTLGAASTQGLRFGRVPRISASAKVNAAFVRVPDVVAERAGAAPVGTLGLTAPALSGALSVGVLPGFTLAPGLAGLGSVDVLGSATWLPFRAFDVEGFGGGDVAYGIGARVGVLRESFIAPGVSVSVMRHRLPSLGFGETCEPENLALDVLTRCDAPSNAGALAFDLTNWSTRAVASKRLLGFGLTGGLGYDRYASDVDYVFHHEGRSFSSGDVRLKQDRWSAFGNLSYTLLIATLGLEAGWQQGSAPLEGYDAAASSFDPRRGHWFGGAGVRLHF